MFYHYVLSRAFRFLLASVYPVLLTVVFSEYLFYFFGLTGGLVTYSPLRWLVYVLTVVQIVIYLKKKRNTGELVESPQPRPVGWDYTRCECSLYHTRFECTLYHTRFECSLALSSPNTTKTSSSGLIFDKFEYAVSEMQGWRDDMEDCSLIHTDITTGRGVKTHSFRV